MMKDVMSVINEAHSVERQRMQMARKNKSEESAKSIQKAKTLITSINTGQLKNGDVKRKKMMVKLEEMIKEKLERL